MDLTAAKLIPEVLPFRFGRIRQDSVVVCNLKTQFTNRELQPGLRVDCISWRALLVV